jgi:hypothetical protein
MLLHLRYSNAHTHWFSCLILYPFHEINDERFKEVVTKILLERFIVHRPHPWGALVTFIELLWNQKYDFWNREFVRIAPKVTILIFPFARAYILQQIERSIFQHCANSHYLLQIICHFYLGLLNLHTVLYYQMKFDSFE